MNKKPKQKINWMKFILRPLTIFKGEPFIEGWVKLGVDTLAIPEKRGESQLYIDKKGPIEFGKKVVEKIKHKKNFVKEHIKECYKTCEFFVRTGKDIGKTDLRKKSNRELYKLFLQYYERYINYSLFLLVPIAIEQFVTKFVEEGIKKILKRKKKLNLLQNYLNIFTTETKMIEVKKDEVSLLKIKIEIEKSKGKITSSINKKINEHIKGYCWIPVYDVTHKPWGKKDFSKRLKEISNPKEKLKRIEKEFRKRKEETQKAIKELKPNKVLLNMIKILQEYVFLRTYRTDAARRVMYYIQPLVEEIGRRTKITKEEAAYITKEEMEEFLLKGKRPDIKTLKERVKHYLTLRTKDVYKIVSDKKEIDKIVKQELEPKKIKWIKTISRYVVPQILTIILSPATTFFKKLGIGFKNHLYVPEGGKHVFHYDVQEFPIFIKNIIKNARKRNYIEKQIDTCIEDSKILIKASKACSKNIKGKSNNKLIKFYLDYLEKFKEFYIHMWIAHPIEQYLEETIKSELEKELNKKREGNLFNRYFRAITTKIKLIALEGEEIELFEIALKIEENNGKINKGIDELIENHVRKYCWLPFYSFDLKLWDKKHFLDALKEIKNPKQKLEKINNELDKKKEKLDEAKRNLKKNKKLIKLIDLLQEYLFFRTERADTMRRAFYYARPFFTEVANRMDWSYDNVVYTTPEELVYFLRTGKFPDLNEIKERQKQFLIISKDGDTRLISKKEEVESIIKEELKEERVEPKILKGNTAYPGIAVGTVRIIRSIKEIGKLKKGEILVTPMTTPDMTIVIHKAAAIVTDEGGITCHAAICSRELKIPCVIGTKNATNVLKDGDLVKVDATKGLVKKIK